MFAHLSFILAVKTEGKLLHFLTEQNIGRAGDAGGTMLLMASNWILWLHRLFDTGGLEKYVTLATLTMKSIIKEQSDIAYLIYKV